jgi:hypothetical protein
MSTRFNLARRALRRNGTYPAPKGLDFQTWESTMLSQHLVRVTEPEMLVPLQVAKMWATLAAYRAIDYPHGAEAAVLDAAQDLHALKALCGWYIQVQDQRGHLGPYDNESQAWRAFRAIPLASKPQVRYLATVDEVVKELL